MYDEFVEDYEPTKADSYRKKVVLDGEEVSSHSFSVVFSLKDLYMNDDLQLSALICPSWIWIWICIRNADRDQSAQNGHMTVFPLDI